MRMEKTHAVVIRTRQSNLLQADFGHAGLSLIDDEGREKHFDFASAVAHKRYEALATKAELTASNTSLVGTVALASYVGSLTAQTFLKVDPNAFTITAEGVATFSGAVAGFLVAPMKSVTLKREGSEETQEEGSYPKTDMSFEIGITSEEYGRLHTKLENIQHQFHMTGAWNCVHKVKDVLSEIDTDIPPSSFIETPNRFQKQLQQHLTQ